MNAEIVLRSFAIRELAVSRPSWPGKKKYRLSCFWWLSFFRKILLENKNAGFPRHFFCFEFLNLQISDFVVLLKIEIFF
jgi:hypothetical protein